MFELSPVQMQKLWVRFHERIPGFTDFTNPGAIFVSKETAYKRRLLAKFQQSVGREKLVALVDAGKGLRAKQEILNCLRSNLVSFHSWNPTLGESDSVICDLLREYLTATGSPYEGPTSTRGIFEVSERHGLSPSWDALSTLLWILSPQDFFPIKISYYRELCTELGHELPSGRPNADALHEVIEFGRAFRHALEPQKSADWVDVQSFIWCVSPGGSQKATSSTAPVSHSATSGGDDEELEEVGQEFLTIMRRYRDEQTVFCSAQRGARYAIQDVDENGCTVTRLDAEEVARCTTSLLADKLLLIRSKGGAHSFDTSFAATSAIRNCLLQSKGLALSADKTNILDVTNPEDAVQAFCDILKALRVDASSGQPKLYKPAMVACVLEGIRNRELTENRISFGWIAPRFTEKMAVLGEQISEREAAMPFFHLTSDLFWMLSYRDLAQLVSDGSEGPPAIRAKVSHASIKDTFWDILQNPYYLEQAETALATKWWPATRTPRFWVEKTIVNGRPDRQEGDNALGRALWSPQTAEDGKEIYRPMLEIRPGDIVFHFVDNQRVDSFSTVAKSADPSFVGIAGTDREGRPAYRVELRDHQPLIPPIERAEFLGDGEYRPSIQELLNSEKGLFFNREFKLNQGAYITEAPLALVRIWNEIHRRKTGSPIRREWNLISESPLIKTPVGLWIFQGSPEHFDIDTYLRDRSNITWSVRQHKDSVHTDDRVLIWRSGAEAGVVAECLVTSEPSIDIAEDEPGLWRSSERLAKDELRCSLQVIDTFVDRRYFATKLGPLFRSYRS